MALPVSYCMWSIWNCAWQTGVCWHHVSGFCGFEDTILSSCNATFPYLANANWFSRTQVKQDPPASLMQGPGPWPQEMHTNAYTVAPSILKDRCWPVCLSSPACGPIRYSKLTQNVLVLNDWIKLRWNPLSLHDYPVTHSSLHSQKIPVCECVFICACMCGGLRSTWSVS